MKAQQKGFTLMEMIGVIAVIAILASMATPMIFEAIRNARVSAQAEEVNVLRTAVANYYKDTGTFPYYDPNSSSAAWRVLRSDNSSSPISGWDGPYIDKELENHIGNGNITLRRETNANYQFDLDGDGTVDTTNVSLLRIDGVSDTEAKKLSDILDGDGAGTGTEAWNASGRVKRYGTASDSTSIVLIYISRI